MNKLYSNLKLMATPSDPKDVVNLETVQAMVNRKLKDAVRVVAGSDLDSTYDSTAKTLTQNAGSEAAYEIDGVTLAVNDRVLVVGQTDKTQNGIYVVTTNGAAESSDGAGDEVAGVLTRADDFNDTAKIPHNVIIPVMEGGNSDTNWQLINDGPVALDSTPLSFAKFKGSEGALVFTGSFTGDGSAKEFVITHGLGTEDVAVSIRDAATNEVCLFDVEITSENVVTIKSDVVLESTDTFDVVVMG